MKFRLSSEYGELSEVRGNAPHHGIDFAMPEGTTLHSVSNGVVERVVDLGGDNLGKGVFVRNSDGTESIYGHMSAIDVKAGQHLNAGDIIGLSGNTGNSTGPHLHFGMKDASGQWLDPTPIAEKVANAQGDVGFSIGGFFLDKFNGMSDYLVGKEVEVLQLIGASILEGIKVIGRAITEVMPEIGALITVVCAVGIMCTGNIPKWLGRWAFGMGGVILWILNGK